MAGRREDDRRNRGGDSARADAHLSNERTILAWVRTAVALIGLGILVARFLAVGLREGKWLGDALAFFLVLVGVAFMLIGGLRYARSQMQIETESFQPPRLIFVVVTALVVLLGVGALGFLIILSRPGAEALPAGLG